MNERPIEPIKLKLTGGEERKFLLSMGGLKRAKEKCGAKTLKDLLDKDVSEVAVPILFEALLDRGALTEDQFADVLPSDLMTLRSVIPTLLGVSMPAPKQAEARPTEPSPTVM